MTALPASPEVKPMRTRYFVRAEDATHFNVIMRDHEGFESVVDSARNGETAEKKAARWQHKEDQAIARAAKS